MGSRRSKLHISIEVLTAISRGEQKPTRIMYVCNLSWRSAKETLESLVARGYVDEIDEDKKRRLYSVTAKGRDAVGYYVGLQNLMQLPL
jgi:predicted transcriptional regulator